VNAREFRERLQRRAKRAGVSIDSNLIPRLETYYRLLATWNEKINLTALNLREASDEAFDRLLIEPPFRLRLLLRGLHCSWSKPRRASPCSCVKRFARLGSPRQTSSLADSRNCWRVRICTRRTTW
jgi:hypothetical protein